MTTAAPSPAGGVSGPAPVVALPRPSELDLATARRASYAEADLSLAGEEYAPALIHQRVAADPEGLAFSPDWESSANGFADLAIAVYVFSAPGYDRKPQLRTAWATPPADAGSVWYALANWGADRWDLLPATGDYLVEPPSFAPYLNFSGDLVAAVIRTGSDISVLETIRLAAPLPVAQLTATPPQGNAPLAVSLDASGSSAAEGSIAKYEFDPEGDGSFVDNGTDPSFDFVYEPVGAYAAQVRITDTQSATALATRQVRAMGPWLRTFSRGGMSGYTKVTAVAVNPAGEIYACGESTIAPGLTQAMVLKYDALGTLLWAKGMASEQGTMHFRCCALDADGNLIAGGYLNAGGGTAALLQKWSPSGNVLWSRSFSGMQQGYVYDVAPFGTELYVTGSRDDFAGDLRVTVLRVTGDGDAVWSRSWYLGTDTSGAGYCAAISSDSDLGSFALFVGGYCGVQIEDPPTWDPAPILLQWDEAGGLTRSLRLGSSNYFSFIYDVMVTGIKPLDKRVHVLGEYYNSSTAEAYIITSDFAGAIYGSAHYSEPGTAVSPVEMCTLGGVTGFIVASTLSNGVNNFGSLIGLDTTTGVEGFEYYWDAASVAKTEFNALRPTPEGLVIGGTITAAQPPGSRGTMGGSSIPSPELWQTVDGVLTESFIVLSPTGHESADLTDGVLNDASAGTNAMVRYEPFP